MTAHDIPSARRNPDFSCPMKSFFNRYRVTSRTLPSLASAGLSHYGWKGLYLLGPIGSHTEEESKIRRAYANWFRENPHYQKWLDTDTALLAPRRYILPELRKLLLVTPRRFAVDFLPPDIPPIFRPLKQNHQRFQTSRRLSLPGVPLLVAHCHGVSLSYLCSWTGKSESQVLSDILEAVASFANTIPYWVWAYRIDMQCVSFLSRRSKTRFRERLKTHQDLSKYPQFVDPKKAKQLFPTYLHHKSTLARLPRLTKKKSPLDTLFFEMPSQNYLDKFPHDLKHLAYDYTSRKKFQFDNRNRVILPPGFYPPGVYDNSDRIVKYKPPTPTPTPTPPPVETPVETPAEPSGHVFLRMPPKKKKKYKYKPAPPPGYIDPNKFNFFK